MQERKLVACVVSNTTFIFIGLCHLLSPQEPNGEILEEWGSPKMGLVWDIQKGAVQRDGIVIKDTLQSFQKNKYFFLDKLKLTGYITNRTQTERSK